jgi:hypothetical protein
MAVAFHISISGLDEMMNTVRSASKKAMAVAAPELDKTLHAAFAATQAVVPVVTGNLKASGKVRSEVAGEVWTGEITYGGPGLDREVDYADDVIIIYNEDFMAPIDDFLGDFQAAVQSGLEAI